MATATGDGSGFGGQGMDCSSCSSSLAPTEPTLIEPSNLIPRIPSLPSFRPSFPMSRAVVLTVFAFASLPHCLPLCPPPPPPGCFSNVDLGGAGEVGGEVAAVPALSDQEFASRQEELRQRLRSVKITALAL